MTMINRHKMVDKTRHRTLHIEQHEPHQILKAGAPESWVVTTPLVTPVALLFLAMR